METETLLNERETTHGDFRTNARVMCELMNDLDHGLAASGARITSIQRAALTHICSKLSRIVCNPRVKDHWDDISGYVGLVLREMNGSKAHQDATADEREHDIGEPCWCVDEDGRIDDDDPEFEAKLREVEDEANESARIKEIDKQISDDAAEREDDRRRGYNAAFRSAAYTQGWNAAQKELERLRKPSEVELDRVLAEREAKPVTKDDELLAQANKIEEAKQRTREILEGLNGKTKREQDVEDGIRVAIQDPSIRGSLGLPHQNEDGTEHDGVEDWKREQEAAAKRLRNWEDE